MGDPDFERLLDWFEGRLDSDEADEIERLLADPESERARETVAWIRSLHQSRVEMMFPEPPAELGGRLRSLFTGRRRDEADHFLAGLVGGDYVGAATAKTRAVGFHTPEQLAYLSPSIDVVMEITRTGHERVRVSGQLLPGEGSAAVFEVRPGTGDPTRAEEFGEFVLEAVHTSVRFIRITSATLSLDIPVNLAESA